MDGERGRRHRSDSGENARDELLLAAVLRARARRRSHANHRVVGAKLALGVVTLLAIAVVAASFGGSSVIAASCSLSSLRPISFGEDSFVFAADGSRLGAIPSAQHREPLPMWKISPWLPKATVAIEDRRFYKHAGLDYVGIARAAVADAKAGRIVEGGSTIEQELARNLYIGHAEKTLTRKVKEACLALKMDDRWPKQQILASYVNEVFYGHQAYGAEAAAETYFSKSARRLGLAQAALLAGLPQSPSAYDPIVHPGPAVHRRNQVLHAMLETGAISPEAYGWAIHRPLGLRPGNRYTAINHPGFVGYVQTLLEQRFGKKTVENGGLRVRTTLDPRLQMLAVNAIKNVLRTPGDPGAALVAINPHTGAIKALMTYQPGSGTLQFNLATQGHRQAGSAFKPFTLVTAIDQGISLDSGFSGPPELTITDPRCLTGINEYWHVHNYADESAGSMNLREALAHSVNTIFAQLVVEVGPDNVARMAHRMGIRTPLQPVCSITLGSQAVTPLEMTAAYATFASRGVYHAPQPIALIRSDRKTLFDFEPKGKRAVGQNAADLAVEALQGVVDHGTAVAAQIGRPAAGKTGTTENHADAWFCGFTPQLVTCVWVGYPQAEIPMHYVEGVYDVVGGSIPAQIWHDFMWRALAGRPVKEFAEGIPTGTVANGPSYYTAPATPTTTTTTSSPVTTTPAPARPAAPKPKAAPSPAATVTPEQPPPTEPAGTQPVETTPTTTTPG